SNAHAAVCLSHGASLSAKPLSPKFRCPTLPLPYRACHCQDIHAVPEARDCSCFKRRPGSWDCEMDCRTAAADFPTETSVLCCRLDAQMSRSFETQRVRAETRSKR